MAMSQVRTLLGSFPAGAGIAIVSGGSTVLSVDDLELTFASAIGHTPGTQWIIAATPAVSGAAAKFDISAGNKPTLRSVPFYRGGADT
jgi:hypothetical protein